MTSHLYEGTTAGTRSAPRPWRRTLIVALLAFVAAALLVTWALTRWEPVRRLLLPHAPPQAPVALIGPAATPGPALPTLPIAGPTPAEVAATASRVAGLESRIAQIDTQATAAAANASRAEGLLIAFAARRSIDRGASLGYLEPQLRMRFADTQPRAVAAIIAAGQAPVTLDMLRGQLDALAPSLGGGAPGEGWWQRSRRALGSLAVVRRAAEPSPAPDDRLARAGSQIAGGQVDLALAEVARLPARERATDWMAMARRYIEAHRALDILEAAAITAPIQAPSTLASPTQASGRPTTNTGTKR